MGPIRESADDPVAPDPQTRAVDFRLLPERSQLTPSPQLHTFDEAAQLLAAARMAQFAQRLGFDLTNTFARHLKVLTDLFECVIRGFPNPEPFSKHFFFSRRQGFQRAVDLALQVIANRRFQGRDRLLVFDEITQMTVFLFSDRGFERDRLPRDLQNLPHLSSGRSIRSAISSGVGSRPSFCTKCREVLMSLLIVSIIWTGIRSVLAWSAIARVIACRIHQVAYVLNLYPRLYSNLSTA